MSPVYDENGEVEITWFHTVVFVFFLTVLFGIPVVSILYVLVKGF